MVMAEGESEARWGGLCSRDSTPRETALENMRQIMVRKTELLCSAKGTPSRPSDGLPDAGSVDGLNELPAPLLSFLRCVPFQMEERKASLFGRASRNLELEFLDHWDTDQAHLPQKRRFFRRGVKAHRCMFSLRTLLLL